MNTRKEIDLNPSADKVNRMPFMPTILEHSASIIGKTPSEAARSSFLMAESHIKAYLKYGHDAVTVGIDVYNIEAEALGCEVEYFEDNSIPGIKTHPYQPDADIIEFDKENGRISKILEAAGKVNQAIGNDVNVGIGICGPFSIAAELAGYQNLLFGIYEQALWVESLLEKLLEHQKRYCDEIAAQGVGITIFESWATPPLISPKIYRRYVKPYEKELISHIKSLDIHSAPLVIGGDTTGIVDDILDTGTTLLVADYCVNMDLYLEKARRKDVILRTNIDPKLVEKGSLEEILCVVDKVMSIKNKYGKLVLGTGVVAYKTPVENIAGIKNYLGTN